MTHRRKKVSFSLASTLGSIDGSCVSAIRLASPHSRRPLHISTARFATPAAMNSASASLYCPSSSRRSAQRRCTVFAVFLLIARAPSSCAAL